MTEKLYYLISITLTLSAIFGYINVRFIKLPTTIAIMAGSLLLSLIIILLGHFGFAKLEHTIYQSVESINFYSLLMQGMLSFLLFAGALNVNINHLRDSKWEIFTLATFSTILSTIIIASLCYWCLPIKMPFIYCLLFGALISPTDPIAVLAFFKEVGAPRRLQMTVTGESLFNDGVGIVLFLSIYQVAFLDASPTFRQVTGLFLTESVGGGCFGILLGLVGYKMIESAKNIKVETLITLAMTTGGYAFANAIGVSGPLAMVTAGIFVGNKGRSFDITRQSQTNLDNFWELIDEVLNAMLFFLIGLELVQISHASTSLIIAALSVLYVLLSRAITIILPMSLFRQYRKYPPHFNKILIWGGLRGGLAVALALSLKQNEYRSTILTMTYSVVIFSVIVQGLTIKPLVRASKKT